MIELPRWDAEPGDAGRCVAAIDAWAAALSDTDAVAAFAPDPAARMSGSSGEPLLDALESFAGEHWDFRSGRERNLAANASLTARQIEAIDSAAALLGLDGTSPPSRPGYDAVIMTGGMVRAGIVKPRYLRELYDAGLAWREGVFLGAFRTFAGDEATLGRALGVDGDNEFDAMTAGMRQAFGRGRPDRSEHSGEADAPPGYADWRVDSWNWNERVLQVVAAPSSDPMQRRANTADTFRFWAVRAGDIRSVLVITTPVYVPYQGAAAIEVLGLEFGFSVETVAVSPAASDLGENSQVFLPQHRAQELRSAIHGYRSLRASLTAGG
ncbi:hypothetical protein BKA04_000525 [Cryobacterium mesophilum]|uniref:Uncharacterized protein n=1 Tax=Terrimesophilobacter mesophilus TaxID=433647 RepID=A0A4R8V9F9_9MICO|nr:hypothetical protein [Terrimesophilobacter mesophilus]MBB5632302.1 hypothetical protein [Terrimesophilobacter mesophilus]TFB79145.1 hypothetical protein E3N84_03195 [Terrimesophilobacter mesophilus]